MTTSVSIATAQCAKCADSAIDMVLEDVTEMYVSVNCKHATGSKPRTNE